MVTYLFGAGASHQVLPTINEIEGRALQLATKISNIESSHPFIKMMNDLAIAARKEVSVDTYAKRLYLQANQVELNKLKVAMMVFFTLEQAHMNPGDQPKIDTRYSNFFAAILDNNRRIPENVKILTWNYDSQIEMTLHGFQHDSTRAGTNVDNISQGYNILEKNSNDGFPDVKKSVVKLNGTATFRNAVGQTVPLFDNYSDMNFLFLLDDIAKKVQGYMKTFDANNTEYSNLSFAWEDDFEIGNHFILKIRGIIKETTSLVIIGYSFPMFNREVDRMIVRAMGNLKTVYIQDINPKIIRDRFRAIKNNIGDTDIVLSDDKDQFLSPYEL